MKSYLKKLLNSLLLLLGVIILAYVILSLDLRVLWENIKSLSFSLLFIVLFLVFLIVLFRVFRWKYLVKISTGVNMSWGFSFYSFIVGFAIGSFTLGRVGEISKPILLKAKQGVKVSKSISTIFLERIFDILSLLLFFFISLIFLPVGGNAYKSVVLVLLVLLVIVLLVLFILPKSIHWLINIFTKKIIRSEKIADIMNRFNDGLYFGLMQLRRKKVLSIVLISSLASMFLEFIRFFLILKFFGLDIGFAIVIFSFCGAVIFGQLTFIPGGIGVTEASQAVLFSTILGKVVDSDAVKSAIIIDRFLTYYLLTLVGGLVLLIKKNVFSGKRFHNIDKTDNHFKREDIEHSKSSKIQTMVDKTDGKIIQNKVLEKNLHDPLELEQWNKELNETNPMSILEKHKNPLVRFEEKQRRKIILDLVGNASGKIIADVGCEEGYNAQRLIRNSKKFYCVDIDENLLEKARTLINDERAIYVRSDAQEIKIPDNSVDIAISSHVLEHLPSPQKGFNELVRIVGPGGRIVINVPNEKVVLGLKSILRKLRVETFLGKLNTGLAPGHLHVFDKKMLMGIIKGKAKVVSFRYNFPFYTNMFVVLEPIKEHTVDN